MDEEATLLQAVLADPYADAPRFAYADWLDKRAAPEKDLRAEFIRLQIRMANEPFQGIAGAAPLAPKDELRRRATWLLDKEREKVLREVHAAGWAAPLASMVTSSTFHRGFVAHVVLPAADFLAFAPDLFDRAPIVLVGLTDVAPVAAQLFVSPHLARVPALSLVGNGLDDADMRLLANSPHLRGLWWLDLSNNRIGLPGVEALAASQNLPALRFVGLGQNPSDPRETVGVDGYVISDVQMPQEGRDLEAVYGRIPWLHYNTESILEYPPDPYRPPPP